MARNTLKNSWPLSKKIAWNTSRSTGPITTSDSLDSMRPNPSTNSLGELRTAEPLSEFHTHSPRMTGKVTLRTADPIHKVIPTLSPAAFLKRSLKPTKLKPPLLELSTVTGSSGGRFLFLPIKSLLRALSQIKPQRLEKEHPKEDDSILQTQQISLQFIPVHFGFFIFLKLHQNFPATLFLN